MSAGPLQRSVAFTTEHGVVVPAVTSEQMREVDRLAVEDFGLGLLQMMENAGRNLAENVRDMLGDRPAPVTVLAGSGGNGGGALCCARHLHNRGFPVTVVLDRDRESVRGAAQAQLSILEAAGVRPAAPSADVASALSAGPVVVDGLIGYGLRGAPTGRTAELIELCHRHARRVLALDVPSGLDATTGAAPGAMVRAERTLTLALPKTGLIAVAGDLYVADIGIPPAVYARLGLRYMSPFGERYWTRLLTWGPRHGL